MNVLLKLNQSDAISQRALANKRACPACGAGRTRSVGDKRNYELALCMECGSIFTSECPGNGELLDLYDHYYDHACFELPSVITASLERLVGSAEQFRCTGRWLDIGYGEGGLLKIAERYGWDCYGADIAPQALEYGERRGWVVAADAEGDPRFPDEGFDVVTMVEFLEHVGTPDRFLRAASRWLRPGGLLYITTPNAESLNRRFLGLEWSVFSPPEHLTIWTTRGLRYALAKAGFQHQRIRTEGFNPYEILARLRSRDQAPVTVDRNQTALVLNNAFSCSGFRRALKRGINHCLSAVGISDSIKAWALRDHQLPSEGAAMICATTTIQYPCAPWCLIP